MILNHEISFHLNQSSTFTSDLFDFNLKSNRPKKVLKSESKDNISFSYFDELSNSDYRLYFQGEFLIYHKDLGFSYFEQKGEKSSEIGKISENIINKNMKEEFQQKIKEKIYIKKPFREKKKLGRKMKSDECLGEHNKFSDDNALRKIRSAVLNNVLVFINHNIKKMNSNLDNNSLKELQLFKLKQNETNKGRVDYNRKLLNRTLKSIFSEDISNKYLRYSPKHNKDLIEQLINEKDETKREFFNKILNLTFVDCLNHFRGSAIIEELNGLKKFEQYFKELQVGNYKEMYEKILKYHLFNYENEIMEKKERNRVSKK